MSGVGTMRGVRHPVRRIAAFACMLMGATACQPGRGGTLDPVAGQPRGPDGPYGDASVSMVSNGIAVQISGNWRTALGGNTLDVQAAYRNLSGRAVVLDATDFRTMWGRERGEVTQVIDMTGVNSADDRDDNDEAVQVINVYEERRRGTIRLAPGEQRLIQVSVALPSEPGALDDGQAISVFVPTVRGTGTARFVTDSGWF